MEKTSREYAEKMADEYCSSDVENFDSQSLYVGKSKHEMFVEIYLKAVEETNVKELREALVNLTSAVVSGKFNKEEEVNAVLSLIDNALSKTKS